MKKITLAYLACLSLISANRAFAQKADTLNLTDLKFKVEAAPEWSALLKRDSGWFGGDGIYTIPLNGKEIGQAKAKDKVLFIFSDSMIGAVRDNTMAPGAVMIHNAVAVLNGNEPLNKQIKFYWDKNVKGNAEPIFVPHTPKTEAKDYYWLGD